jgi:hypothetical protein
LAFFTQVTYILLVYCKIGSQRCCFRKTPFLRTYSDIGRFLIQNYVP